MPLLNISSPHITDDQGTQALMLKVMLGLVPGIILLAYFTNFALLIQCVLALLTCVLSEALMLKLRAKPIFFHLQDLSACVSALLIAVSIPAIAPWWVVVIGSAFAIIFVKHLYGGLGQNPFNPAMVAYVLLLISFPLQMTQWPAINIDLSETFQFIFSNRANIDAFTGATPLDYFKTELSLSKTSEEIFSSPFFHASSFLNQWAIVNLCFLIGGIYLIITKVITWHIPVSFLGGLFIISFFFYLIDPSHYPSPIFHLLNGATMLAAFFIATDPVTAASTFRGRILYATLMSALVYIIRTWGGFPDAVAFAVLLMNIAAPTIDQYTIPRTYGHSSDKTKR